MKFRIRYEIEEELTVDEIWPDGDAPENPTADDVHKLLKDGSLMCNLQEWNLTDYGVLHVTKEGDDDFCY